MAQNNRIREMFDSIAGKYDSLNHLMSFDIDKLWRKKAIMKVVDAQEGASAPKRVEVLDLACGTGDFSIAIARKLQNGHVTGADISEGMLAVMKEKVVSAGLSDKISMGIGDGENLAYADGSFQRVTIAFGIRNFSNRMKGLGEMLRVLVPGGRVVILELSRPENPIMRCLYDFYAGKILPLVGGAISGDKKAYTYLPASVAAFPGRKEFMAMMTEAGFVNVTHKAFTFGICRMYIGEKPSDV